MNRITHCTVFCFSLMVAVFSAEAADTTVDFNRDIRPILFGHCITCHGPDESERAADLRLDVAESATADLGGYAAIKPGDPDGSEIMLRITSEDPDVVMPPPEHGQPLEKEEVDLLSRWIRQGARFAKHWSYEVPIRPELPTVNKTDWVDNPIDRFVLARLEAEGIAPQESADRLTLARRVAIDLTGLPPTWEEAQAFVHDDAPNAYGRYVDSLLRKPAFGERWARVWLDLARYADSAGYADDPPRTIWAYRDYVIRSLNENKPFDQFTIEQIAGDLLPEPTEEQLIATAFHRNTLTNNEGGTNNEEFRNVAVVDRVNTTMATWMGTTMACAQCHTHKYDPITHEEYFQFFAFFNSTEDADRRDESPLLTIWSDAQLEKKKELEQRIQSLQDELAAPSEAITDAMNDWLNQLKQQPTWSVAAPTSVTAENRDLEIGKDGWITAVGDEPENDRYTVQTATGKGVLSAIKLEVNQASKQNFVLSQVVGTWTPNDSQPVEAQFVRLQLPGKNRILHVAEIEAFEAGVNVATKGKATQSSTDYNAPAGRVNDGNPDGDFDKNSVTHSTKESDPWIEIDLGAMRRLDRLVVSNRTDNGDSIVSRLNGFNVQLLRADRSVTWQSDSIAKAEPKHEFSLGGARPLVFTTAVADMQQDGFPAVSVLDKQPNPKTGWAVAPQPDKPHELTLVLSEPLPTADGRLALTLIQSSIHKQHTIDHFRILQTNDENVTTWAAMPKRIRGLIRRERGEWSDDDLAAVEKHFRNVTELLAEPRAELAKATQQLQKMKPATSVPVMRQLPEDKHRVTNIQIRGNYLSKGDEVSEGTPAAFHPLDNSEAPNRLDLAHWLVDPENPLTARVIVNRHWEQLFGIGIVETSEEFGSQGELPSHPELLDWMAVELQESGWDLKHLLRLMVTSATYKQKSVTSSNRQAADPANRMLSRGPRFRVSAEMIRDQALAVSGLLSSKMFGPPVNPPQPELGLKAAFGSATDWKTSRGEDRFRRGIYTTWRRSSPYPSMAQFDAPNREVCTVRRIRTNTPLQALVTLNDPVYIEAAQALARRMVAASDRVEERIRFAFRTCLIREPSETELERLTSLVEQAKQRYASSPAEAIRMAAEPLGPLEPDQDAIEYAAWTVVANVMLNLDEFFLKR